ncbi:hypothetical protein EfmJHP38_12080 [Enterococcus faecium]|nr:hypothetical protein EfmJHP38_12080 [Enterococcus faecium]
MSATDDYSKALVEPETDIRNELGTGNISMSVYDLNKFFTSVLSGDIIPKELPLSTKPKYLPLATSILYVKILN